MAGTPWANYMLIGSQWVGGDTPPNTLAIPAQLANSAIETYIQDSASCVQCHAMARTAVGTPADFSFLLALALVMKGQRLEYVFKGLAATPIRYALLGTELITIGRFATDLWITNNRSWRK